MKAVLVWVLWTASAQRGPAARRGRGPPQPPIRYDLTRPGEKFTELPPIPGVAADIRIDSATQTPFGTTHQTRNLEEILTARGRNLELCTKELTRAEASAEFALNASVLRPEARIYRCIQRDNPYSGALYVTDFFSRDDLAKMYSDWPTEKVLVAMETFFHNHGELQGQARMGTDMAVRPNSTAVIKKLEKYVDDVTGLRIGKYAHKRYDLLRGSGSAILNPLHHDDNGACCGLQKGAQARVLTMLLYTLNDNIKGGHTLFPFLQGGPEPGTAARHVTDNHWREIQDIYIKRPITQSGRFGRSLPDWVGRKCADLAKQDADNQKADPTLFGIRPAAGDALLFWMKNADASKSDPYMFHCSCPILGGTKDGIQKFLQTHLNQEGWKTSYDP